MESAEELVENNTRKELNKISKEEGIEEPENRSKFPKKMALAKEIVRSRKADKYAKKPTGLYIGD